MSSRDKTKQNEKRNMQNSDEHRSNNLDPFFRPQRIALVGASEDHTKLGHSILNNLLSSHVEVYPISRGKTKILGINTFSSL